MKKKTAPKKSARSAKAKVATKVAKKAPAKKTTAKKTTAKKAPAKAAGGKESVAAILKELKANGSETTKRTLMRHGAREPFYGVKVEYLKVIQKRIKKDYQLALDLYATGVSDAMYLAGLIADETKMTKADLETWLDGAYWYMISEFTVPWVASEGPHGWELGLKWIESEDEKTASAGWTTLANLVSIKPDEELDFGVYSQLLDRVRKTIHQQPNFVRRTMNGFVISVGGYLQPLTEQAKKAAKEIGVVTVDMGDTACKTPFAPEYIEKMHARGQLGKKRKTCRC